MLDDGRLKWRGLELVRRVSFRLVDVTRIVPRVTDAINSRETRERKLLDDTKRRDLHLLFPRDETRRAGRSTCITEGRRTSRLRGQITGFANSQSARWLRNDRLAISITDVPAFDSGPAQERWSTWAPAASYFLSRSTLIHHIWNIKLLLSFQKEKG